MTDTGFGRIEDARMILEYLGFDAERSNERSALVLLALLHLRPEDAWSEATRPVLGLRSIMDWIRDEYGFEYAANSRKTIRRLTLHQFLDAALEQQNPDDPRRLVNSPMWCYQIHHKAAEIIRNFDSDEFSVLVEGYLHDVPGLRAQYEAAREMDRIPVMLPDGSPLTLSPFDQSIFAVLKVEVDEHGKMPDLVVYLPDKNWLVLMEAATSHGPVDAKRHRELANLFAASTAGLVFVSCFPSRAVMRKYLARIAWETEVWCADNPTHLIHFNGERFLGPYE